MPLLVVEDNYPGALAAAVAVAAGRAGGVRLDALTPARMPKSGKSADDVLTYVGLDVPSICRRAKALVEQA